MATMKMELKVGESLTIGDVTVTLESKSGQFARLAIVADKSIRVARVLDPASPVAIAAGGITHRPG